MKKLLSVLSLSALLLASCSKSSSPTSNNNNNNNNGNTAAANQVVVTVNGTTTTFVTVAHTGGSYTNIPGFGNDAAFAIAGKDSVTNNTFVIGGGGFVTNQTYDLGLEHTTPPTSAYGFSATYKTAAGNVSYGTDQNKTTKVGTITITSINATGAQGTFTGTLPQTNPSGTSNSVSVSGSFNVTF